MSTLFVNTIKPDSGSNVLVSASLIVSESLKVAGDFELSGSIKLGNADTDSVGFIADVSSSILPDADLTYNLGSSAKKWKELHVGNITASRNILATGSIHTLSHITASGNISCSGELFFDRLNGGTF